jgi:hypothetical protein
MLLFYNVQKNQVSNQDGSFYVYYHNRDCQFKDMVPSFREYVHLNYVVSP